MTCRYRVILRRDVQQVLVMEVEATNPQEAIDTARSFSGAAEADEWTNEQTSWHKPEVKHIRGRSCL